MQNPLIDIKGLPLFKSIKPEHIEPALDAIISDNYKKIDDLLNQSELTWNSFIFPLEDLSDQISKLWGTVEHLNNVVNSDQLRIVYNKCLPKIVEYHTKISHNVKLYEKIKELSESKIFNTAQKKVLSDTLRDFRLSGIALDKRKKRLFARMQKKLADYSNQFQNNCLDATEAWTFSTQNEKMLSGLPARVIQKAKELAEEKNLSGYVFTLESPNYIDVLTYADDENFRKTMYEAYVTKASEIGPNGGQFDNGPLMKIILAVRNNISRLLDFPRYSDYSLATKMAESTDAVFDFLYGLANRTKHFAVKQFDELRNFAKEKYGISELNAWDIQYYSEKLKQKTCGISDEELRPYFPECQVMTGMFELVKKLFSIEIKENRSVETWHKDAKYYDVFDANSILRGGFYTDLYARPKKRSGAWMDECLDRRILQDGSIQIPVAYLNCNFSEPTKITPSLLTHQEIETLFHEFGHCLQHMLTKVDYLDVSGIHGVEWDAVELASQFMENFCWQKDVINLISKHYETGVTLPENLFEKLLSTKKFQAGLQMARQLVYSLFDFQLHHSFNFDDANGIKKILDELRKEYLVIPTPEFNRFQNSFMHIFSGEYAAGYYSYKWAEVLSSDAFSRFEEEGIFNPKTGKSFLETVLEQGGSKPAMDIFVEFRGRKPTIDALLRHTFG